MNWLETEILSGVRLKNTAIVRLEYHGPNGRKESLFADIRGGLAFGTEQSPFFAVIVGQPMLDRHIEIRDPVFELLHEWQDDGFDLEMRHNMVADLSSLYCCDWFCNFQTEKQEGSREAFWDFKQRHPQTNGDLVPAPYAQNWRTGLELCKSLVTMNKLKLPKNSEVYTQLTRFSRDDFGKKVAERFYAIEALRHVISSFKRDPVIIKESSYRLSETGDTSWMAH